LLRWLRNVIYSVIWPEKDEVDMALTPICLRLEAADGRVAQEYRIRDGQIEVRQLSGPADDHDWCSLSAQDLSSHVMRNTVVAQWLKHRLGWRRLLQACVAQDSFWHSAGDQNQIRRAS
jgi:hypothetical protein